MRADSHSAVQFLETAYEPTDWIALFLKSYETGRTAQRVGPLALFLRPTVHAWLRAMNAHRYNIFVGVNAIRPGVRARTKQAIATVRHVFLDADAGGPSVLCTVRARPDLPQPSYVLTSSPTRVHVLWRVVDFTRERVEALQRHLASELRTDPAATPCSQTTRLPGYFNHKYRSAPLVTVQYGQTLQRFPPQVFPTPPAAVRWLPTTVALRPPIHGDVVQRARRYLARVEPAIAGHHGDQHTFRVCCRVVRGFALSDGEALSALEDWNRRCTPPWNERELFAKIVGARKYGREPVGSLLTGC